MVAFDPAADFLLDIGYLNLFEPTETSVWWRCKGCQQIVVVNERQKHHRSHGKDRDRVRAQRAKKVNEERARNLARARKARAAA